MVGHRGEGDHARETVGLVLSGGGARGAYEIGVLSELLPALQERPSLFIGTSVGALNTAYIAANVQRGYEALMRDGTRIWETIAWSRVLAPPWSPTEIGLLARYLLGVAGLRRARVQSLLDPAPLARTIERLIPDFGQIARNVADGRVASAAVVATSALTSRSVVFHEGGAPKHQHDHRRGIDYAPTALTSQHVRASAAIPVLFPAVHVDRQPGRGWYSDGGTRLNTPIKPALWLGAERIIAIGLNSIAPAPDALAGEERPDLFAGAGQLFQAVLADALAHDVQTLATVNELSGANGGTGRRRVPYIFVAPREPNAIGRIAAECFREHYGSLLRAARSPELSVFARLIEGDFDPMHGELLSYLFFSPEFGRALIELGRGDARRWLQQPHDDGVWQVGPLAPRPEDEAAAQPAHTVGDR